MGSHSSATLTARSRTPARLVSGRRRTASLISKHWSSSRFAKTAMVLISRREFEHAIPYRSALLPPLDAQRHLASSDREPLRAQQWIGELSKDEPVVTFCVYGFHIGCETAGVLRKAGFDARYMAGGHFGWKASKGEVKLFESASPVGV